MVGTYNTVNVITYEHGVVRAVYAFADTPVGNRKAERRFTRAVRLILMEDGETDTQENAETVRIAIEDGFYHGGDGCEVYLVHSE